MFEVKSRISKYLPILRDILQPFEWEELPPKRAVLGHDTRSNDSQSNDARFMHKLCKNAFYIEINRDIKGIKKKSVTFSKNAVYSFKIF